MLKCLSTAFFFLAIANLCYSECQQSVEVGFGWRRDNLNWNVKDMDSSYICAEADSHIIFKGIEYYTTYAKAKWMGDRFYARLGADYGLSFKGRAKERFHLDTSYCCADVVVHTSDPVKRRSEEFDFNGAVGYPLCGCRWNVIPLIGFSFHRQRLRVKAPEHCSCCCYDSCYERYTRTCPSSSEFDLDTCYCSYPFGCCVSSNPFASPSSDDPRIADQLNLSTSKRTSMYRFTWYGFYLGADISYALDCCWTLYSELEGHFLDRCHRKRHSITGVYFVDSYHHEGWAYGFSTNTGAVFSMSACWYGVLSIDYRFWKGYSCHDSLKWQSVGANASLGYIF
jgi:hypothetical protein